MPETYKIVRMYFNDEHDDETIETDLTLQEAQAYCRDPETCSRTCKLPSNVALTEKYGAWFDGFTEE